MNTVAQSQCNAFQRLLDTHHFYEPVGMSDEELSSAIMENSKETPDAFEKITVGLIYPTGMTWSTAQNCLDYLHILASMTDSEFRVEERSDFYKTMFGQMTDLFNDRGSKFQDMVDMRGFMAYNTANDRRIKLPTRELVWEVN